MNNDDIVPDTINQAFRNYRASGHYEVDNATHEFQQSLEYVALQYPDLVGRSADLQHRLDELLRSNKSADSDVDPY